MKKPGHPAQKLSDIDYEGIVQAILDRHGMSLEIMRRCRRARGNILATKIEIAKVLKAIGVTAANTARILGCTEWTARYFRGDEFRSGKKSRDLKAYYGKQTKAAKERANEDYISKRTVEGKQGRQSSHCWAGGSRQDLTTSHP